MKLKEICDKTGISKRNIHYYIKENLLCPRQDRGNGYYEFSEEDRRRLEMVRLLRNAGFSISQIRSILNKPSTAGYYLNLRLKQLKSEIEHANATIEALSYIQEHLPLHIRYQKLEVLVKEAGIPMPPPPGEMYGQDYESYDNDLVNRYLWESFLPEIPMTDYQEYLWSKVIRFSNGHLTHDYQLLSQTLHRFSSEQIDQAFAGNKEIHNEVIDLSPDDYGWYAEKMIDRIRCFLNSPNQILEWKSRYLSFTAPQTRLYDSEIALTMEELSSSFRAYRKNINATCKLSYDWLCSDNGAYMRERMNEALGTLYDIDHCSHGELQAMAMQAI